MPVYCATKAYNWVLAESMRDAYGDKIDFLTVTPANVETQLDSGRWCFSISAERHAEATINQLGRQSVTRGSVIHALQPRITAVWPIGWAVSQLDAKEHRGWAKN